MTQKPIGEDYSAGLGEMGVRTLPVTVRGIFEYLSGKMTPARMMTDAAAAFYIPLLHGKIIEIGAANDRYRKHACADASYLLSNVTNDQDRIFLNALDMDLADNSVDSYVCISVLEHIPDPFKAIGEIHRTLKKGGKLLLIVPFLYPFHADPSDFYRYTEKGLAVMLKGYRIHNAEAIGNSFSTLSLILQKPLRFSGMTRLRRERKAQYLMLKIATSPVTFICRLLGFLFYLFNGFLRKPSDYASMYCVLAEKAE